MSPDALFADGVAFNLLFFDSFPASFLGDLIQMNMAVNIMIVNTQNSPTFRIFTFASLVGYGYPLD